VTALHGYVQRPRCPCCDADAARAKKAVSSEPAAESLPPEALGRFLSGFDARRVFFSYYRCPDCDLLYCPTHLAPAQLDALYRDQPENMEDAPLAARLETQRDYFGLLRSRSPMTAGYLELGADIGLFVQQCVAEGRFDHYWLFEPNEAVHDALRRRLAGRPYTLRRFFEAGDVPAGEVSTAVMIHVLDHVLDPVELLRSVATTLEPGGVLFVVTHDAGSLLQRLLRRRWPPYTLQHPQLFDHRSLRHLMQRCGFERVELTRTHNYFPASFLIGAALSVCGVSARLLPRWELPTLRLRLGNVATIAVKTGP
jgi:hypothetical protein